MNRGASRLSGLRRLGLAATLVTGLAGCSAGSAGSLAAQPTPSVSHWWSHPAGPASSAGSSAAPSAPDYCSILRDTVSAGRSLLSGVGATDPVRVASTRAFVTEVVRVAPAEVARSWQVFGPALVALVTSGSTRSTVPDVDVAAVARAADSIAADAKSRCNLDLSA